MLKEACELVARSHVLALQRETTKGRPVSTITSTQAASLYTAGKSVVEVAQELGITYGRARKLIQEAGTPIRNTSDRLKGKTRKAKAK